jgi:hypothetical protein
MPEILGEINPLRACMKRVIGHDSAIS